MAGELIPGLPDDIAAACIARVPCCFYPVISLVCKSWQYLLRSHTLISLRRNLRLSYDLFFIMTRSPRTHSYNWFVLCGNYCGKHCEPLPLMPSQPVGAACVALGSKLFVIGGSLSDIPTSRVFVFDTAMKAWSRAPSMSVCREFSAAVTIEGKIYVVGGCQPSTFGNSSSWAEVYDPVTQAWSSIPSSPEIHAKWMHGSVVLHNKLLAMSDRGGVVYDPMNSSWDTATAQLNSGWRGRAAVVDGILYSYDISGMIKGFDPCQNKWLVLEGIQEHLPKFLSGATLANVSGNLHVIWETHGSSSAHTDFMCAALHACKDSSGSLSGKILWSKVILSLPQGTSIIHCLSLSV